MYVHVDDDDDDDDDDGEALENLTDQQIRDEFKERGLGGANMVEIPPAEAAAKLRDAATELRKYNSIAHANWLEDIARMMEQ